MKKNLYNKFIVYCNIQEATIYTENGIRVITLNT